MKKVFMFLIILFFGLCLPIFTFAEVTEENPLLPDSLMPEMIESTGTNFEMNNSEYLNIILESSEAITLRLESVPEMITMHIESASEATSSQITISGFQPLTTYYKYEDDYHSEEVFTTDGNGSYSWTQDLSQTHFVFIQPRKSTKFIKDDTSGGDCYLIGNWDWTTKTCTLTTDVYETIQIDSDYITLDGNGHTITGTGTGYGVYLYGRGGVIIKNLNVEKFSDGISLWYSSNNNISGNTVSNNSDTGIFLSNSSTNTLTGNISLNNNRIGIILWYSSNNTLTNNTASNNLLVGISIQNSINNYLNANTAQENDWFYDLHIYVDSDIYCNNVIQNTTGSGGRPIKYFNSSVSLQNEVLSELILCNADYSNIDNVTIAGSETLRNNGLLIIRTDYSNITNTTSSNNYDGILLHQSSNCTLTDNTLLNNSNTGIFLNYSNNNQVYNNNFISNRALVYGGSGNVFNLDAPIGGNYWSDFDTPAKGCYDTNRDGFCDAPYYFYYGGVDHLPWTRQNGWEVPADTTPPTVTVTATPSILWPPNHKMVDVRIDGSATDEMSGIASVVITVTDEYGIYNMVVPQFGSTIRLEAWREGTDKDGRHYTITVVATDNAGNQSTATSEVIVPHDMRK